MMIMKLALFIHCILAHCQGYKILMFVPGVSHSHVQFDYRLANMIAEKGHKVTVLLEDYSPLHNKIDLSPGVNEIVIDSLKGCQIDKDELLKYMTKSIFEERGETYELTKNMLLIFLAGHFFAHACENLINDMKLINQLKEEHYDLAIVDNIGYCPFGLIKILGIPSHIWMSSGLLIDLMATAVGAPNHPSYVPHLMSTFSDKMSFGQRLINFLVFVGTQPYSRYIVNKLNGIIRKHHGPNVSDLGEVASKSSLIFVNSDEYLDFPRPILHKIIYIGGLGLASPKPLEPKWLKIMDESKGGVVLFSFGSIANSTLMPQYWKDAFLGAFSKFPDVTFIWKFESHLPSDKVPKNVVLSKWVPQVDLLGHPKTKAFITHSGYNSLLESLTNGIPVITIPLFADQFGNCKRAERKGVAITIGKWQINEKFISNALEQVLYNSSYKRSAERLSNLIRKKPVKSSELVVTWIEYVAENKGLPDLEPASIDMNWIEYLSLDIIAFLAFVNCLSLIAFYFGIKFCIHFFIRKKSKKKND